MKMNKKFKKAVMAFITPYLVFLLIAFFILSIFFMGVEVLWEQFTSPDGIEEITVSSDGLIWPLPGYNKISSYYGLRFHPVKKVYSFHDGIDLPAPQDTKIISPSSGIVTKVYNSSSVGKTVEIENTEYRFVFHHLNYISVTQGSPISKGEEVGGVGTTGTLSTGNHLHFTVYKNNSRVNPLEIYNFNKEYAKANI